LTTSRASASPLAHPDPTDGIRLRAEIQGTCDRIRPVPGLRGSCAEVLELLVSATGAPRASLLVLNPDTGRLNMAAAVGLPEELVGRDMPPRPRSISEWVFRNRLAVLLNGEVKDERFEGTSAKAGTQSSICLPIETPTGPLGVLNLARHAPAAPFTQEDLAVIGEGLRSVAANVRHAWRAERAERSLRRLEAADGAPGRTMIPAGLLEVRNYQIALARRPGWNLGGDLCDRVPHGTGGNTLMVADVSGGGASAALTAGFAQGLFVGSASPERSAAGLVAQLNVALHSRAMDGRYIALWVGQLMRNGEVASCTAGYPPPFWVPADGSPTVRLDRGGPLAGAFPEARYEEERVRLLAGDLIVAVSDGLLGERDATDQAFGAERLSELLQDLRRQPLDRLAYDVCEAARAFSGRTTPIDDFVVLGIRYRPEG
jgi:hypothetical protein